MKKRLNLILNGKGGVGKSFFAINFVQYLKDRGVKHLAVDTDNENSTLKRFHADALFVDLSKPTSVDPIFTKLSDHPLVVVDCRAASTDIFLSYFGKYEIFDVLKRLDTSLTLVLPVNHDPDSVKQIQILSDQFQTKASYVVVKNHSFSDQFDIYENSKTRMKISDELNGKEIEMPMLNDWLVVALNQTTSTITPALRSEKFTIMDRQRLLIWQRDFYAEIKSAREFLLPPGKFSGKDREADHE